MKTTSVKTKVYSLPQATEILSENIRNCGSLSTEGKKRFEIEIEPADLLAWLYAQETPTKIYYKSRDSKLQIAAIEAADRIIEKGPYQNEKLYGRIRSKLKTAPKDMRYLGGICFEPGNMGQEWSDFNTAQFVLPMIEIVQDEQKTLLAVNVINALSAKKALKKLSNMLPIKNIPELNSLIAKREDVPSKLQWCAGIEKVLESIQNERIEKAVMARRVDLRLNENISPLTIVRRLERTIERCSLFLFQFNEESAFIGASPELLFKREGAELQTEAIAGTRSRGTNDRDDLLLSKDLLASTKDKNEQHLVVTMIRKQMLKLCADIKEDASPQILKTNNGMHLMTKFTGEIATGITDGIVIDALHPTPAIGGTPTTEALRIIRENEGIGRGWYAGAVGYLGLDRSEFSVSIRCALVKDNNLKLFSGAGIVAGSFPLAEWEETEYKLTTFLDIFKSEY